MREFFKRHRAPLAVAMLIGAVVGPFLAVLLTYAIEWIQPGLVVPKQDPASIYPREYIGPTFGGLVLFGLSVLAFGVATGYVSYQYLSLVPRNKSLSPTAAKSRRLLGLIHYAASTLVTFIVFFAGWWNLSNRIREIAERHQFAQQACTSTAQNCPGAEWWLRAFSHAGGVVLGVLLGWLAFAFLTQHRLFPRRVKVIEP